MPTIAVPRTEARIRRWTRAVVLAAALTGLALAATTSGAQEIDDRPSAPEDGRLDDLLGAPVDPSSVAAGTLMLRGPDGLRPLPLRDNAVEIVVTGVMARGTVTQVFANPTDQVVEAVYLFPLPDRAAVHHMEMLIGERHIVSMIREKQEARRTYERAKKEGKKAALLEQSRPNLFTTSVANVNPGEEVVVILEYVEEVGWQDGAFHLTFPMTFTPRYFGGGPGEEGLEPTMAGSALGPAPPVGRSRVRVRIRPGIALDEVACLSHPLLVEQNGDLWEMRPAGDVVVADRDLRLTWRPVVGDLPEAALVSEHRDDGGYGMLMVFPPELDDHPDVGIPTETLFIVDVSGSMEGPSLDHARAALLAALDALRPEDTFNLLRFSSFNVRFRDGFVPARGPDLQEARRWVRGLVVEGGTEILPALEEGLELMAAGSPARTRRMIFVTDGAVANESAVLRTITGGIGDVRLHTLGIGHAPNAWLMRKMARLGRGVSGFVFSTDGVENLIADFFRKLSRPVMTDLQLSGLGLELGETYPAVLPDLHAGEPLVVSFRLDDRADRSGLALAGRTHWGWFHEEVALEPLDTAAGRDLGVATRWARSRVTDLMDSLHEGADAADVRREVVEVATSYHLVTAYTSLVAVEEIPTAEGDGRTVRASARTGLGTLPRGGTLDPLKRTAGGLLSLLGALALLPWLLARSR